MSILAIISLIATLIQVLPTAVGIVKQIIELIGQIQNHQSVAVATQALGDAVKSAKGTGDARPLQDLLNQLRAATGLAHDGNRR